MIRKRGATEKHAECISLQGRQSGATDEEGCLCKNGLCLMTKNFNVTLKSRHQALTKDLSEWLEGLFCI